MTASASWATTKAAPRDGEVDATQVAMEVARDSLTGQPRARSIRTQPKSSYQEWQRDRPVEATTTYRQNRQGAKSGQVLLHDKGTSLRRPPIRPGGRPSPGPEARSPAPETPMAIETLPATPPARPAGASSACAVATAARASRSACRYVCPACFGPLEVALRLRRRRRDAHPRGDRRPRARDLALRRAAPRRRAADARAAGRLDAAPRRPTASRPTLGLDRLWIKDDTRNPSLSFKDRAVAVAAARAVEFGVEALACASTGNLAGATAAAAAALGLPAYVFIPADLEPAKVDHALAYGATVVPIEGTYDDVNRLCLEVADETGWGFVNINLRPFYAEGSKTLAYEIAESLGWRSPDVVVAPVASGAMFTRVARGFEELVELGLIERRPIRFVGGQAAGCAPVATAWAAGTDVIEPVREPDTIVRSLAIGNPADGRYAVELVNETDGSIEAIEDVVDRRGHPRRRPARGDLPGDGRRRDPGRGRGRAASRRDPARRRGRRAADRQRPQDARTPGRSGIGDGGRAGPVSPAWRRSSGRACRPSSAGWKAATREHGPDPADPADRDRRREAGRGRRRRPSARS